jgi:hypothetical protein
LTSYKSCLSAHRRNVLSSRLAAGNKEDTWKKEKSGEKTSDIVQQTMEEFGRYFGICGSYHNLKACTCKNCPSYSGGAGMFCSRGKHLEQGKKQGCLCETCELFRKFRFEGEYFCLNAEKLELSEEKPEFLLNNCGKAPESSGKTRFCVLGELNK